MRSVRVRILLLGGAGFAVLIGAGALVGALLGGFLPGVVGAFVGAFAGGLLGGWIAQRLCGPEYWQEFRARLRGSEFRFCLGAAVAALGSTLGTFAHDYEQAGGVAGGLAIAAEVVSVTMTVSGLLIMYWVIWKALPGGTDYRDRGAGI